MESIVESTVFDNFRPSPEKRENSYSIESYFSVSNLAVDELSNIKKAKKFISNGFVNRKVCSVGDS